MTRERSLPGPDPDRLTAAPGPLARVLLATDLAAAGAGPTAWTGLKVALADLDGGLTTPAGHRFTPCPSDPGPTARRVEIVPPPRANARRSPRAATARPDERSLPTVSVRPTGGLFGLNLEIARDRAVVEIAPAAWDRAAPAVLLAVSLAWRFLEVDRQLDGLTTWAASRPGGRRALGDRLRAIRRLGLDLSCSEGPLVDPRGYLPSPAALGLFRALARPLGLARWRDRLDERCEAVEGTLESLADERRHLDVLAYEVGLELLILAALALDIGLNLYFNLYAGE